MSTSKQRCLFVGMGGIARAMHRILEEKPWYELAGLVEVNAEVLEKAGKEYGLPRSALFADLNKALDELDADVVFLNTPSELHFEQARAALEAGRHLMIAKPITNNYEQAVELVRLAESKGLKLTVGQQIRYNKHYLTLKRFIESGQLGKVESIHFMNSKPRPDPLNLTTMDQPALYENACHHFDSFIALLRDSAPTWIMCDGFRPSWSRYAGPCMVNALIKFDGGKHLLYHCGFSAQAECYEFRLEGTRGVLRCHGIHMSNDTMRYEFAERLGKFNVIEPDADVPTINPWIRFFDRWVDYMEGGSEPPFSGRNNLQIFALLSAGIDSINRGQPEVVAGNDRYAEAFPSMATVNA